MKHTGLSIWFGEEEDALFKRYGREIIEGFIKQHMTLYRIDVSDTDSNFYGESKRKVYHTPVDILCRISIADSDVLEEGGVRRVSKGDMTSWIYLDTLGELGVEINVGDFLGYQGKFYEVYDAGYNKDSVDRKFAGDRDYYREILSKAISTDIFKSIEMVNNE